MSERLNEKNGLRRTVPQNMYVKLMQSSPAFHKMF